MSAAQTDDYYVTGMSVAHFMLAAERLGVPARKLALARGLDPDVIMQLTSRINIADFEGLFMDLTLASGDEHFGYHLGQQVMPGVYGALTNLAFSSITMRDLLELTVRFQGLAGGTMHGFVHEDLDDGGILATWTMANTNPIVRRHVGNNVFTLLAHVISMLYIGGENGPAWVSFASPPPPPALRAQLEGMLRCPLHFDAELFQCCMSAEYIDTAVNPGSLQKRDEAVRIAEQQMAEQQQQRDWVGRVRQQMHDMLVTRPPQREVVARRLGMSARTLDRRLKEHDTSWQQLLDGVRAQLAQEYLADPTLSVQDIALRLGFSDVRALQRRFRVWTGMAPSDYREQLKSSDRPRT